MQRWPDAINTHLWTYAIRTANDSRNYATTNKNDTCPIFVQPAVYLQFKISIILDVQHMF
jgi:hypothetical protein